MTCKGLIALVVINLGLDAKAITPKFFSILVLLVLVCTVGTVPLVMPLATVIRSGTTSKCCAAKGEPRRPKPVITSSKISRMPCLAVISRRRCK